MKLTALEIKQQKFEKTLRGYDPNEVNAFLNMVSLEWENIVTRQRDMERDLAQMKDKLKHYERVESALHETLQAAKESAEQRLNGAKNESRARIEKAELEAESAAAFDDLTRSGRDDALVQQGPGNWPTLFRSARFIPAVEYLQANRLRTELIAAMDALFHDFDVIVAPVWAGDSLLYGNMTGHPCVVVPNADLSAGAAPSFCFLGKLFGEGAALEAAAAYQRATSWHRQRPDLSRLE